MLAAFLQRGFLLLLQYAWWPGTIVVCVQGWTELQAMGSQVILFQGWSSSQGHSP